MDTLRQEYMAQLGRVWLVLVLRKKEGQVPRYPCSGGKKLEFHGAGIRVDKGGANRGQIGKKTKQPPGRGLGADEKLQSVRDMFIQGEPVGG